MAYRSVAYSTTSTIDNTQFFTDYVLDHNIKGVFVECGVAAGAQIAAIHDRLLARGEKRWIYGFDSFEGIPFASKDDDEQPGMSHKPVVIYNDTRELLKSSGITVCSKEAVLTNFNTWFPGKVDTVVLVKGWFQDTLGPYKTIFKHLGGISLLRLDGDLYESTKVSLEKLFPLINSGGILIVDDWQLTGCRKACLEYFETVNVTMIDPPHGSPADGPAYFIKN